MHDRRLLQIGIGGAIVALVCCFTPLLVVIFAAIGLSAWAAGVDYVLFPTLAFCLAITGYALWKRRNRLLS